MSKAVSFETSAQLAEARALYQDGRLQEAEQLLTQISRNNPNNPETLYLLGAIAYRTRIYDSSVRMMLRVIALQPRHHDAQLTLGMAYRAQKKPREALVALRKAAVMKPSSLDGRFHLALAEIEAGDLKAAAKNLERAVKIDPESAHVRNTYASVLFQLGDRDESLRQLRKAAAIASDSADMQQNLAVALQTNGQHEEAVEQFRRVLALVPDHFDAMYGMANSLTALRQIDEAYTFFERLLKEGPKMVPPRSNYALALRHGNRAADSVAQFRQALTDSHGEPFVAANLAESLVAAGETDEALKVLRASAENRPTEGIMLQLGDLLARLGKFGEATAQLERVLKRQPDNSVALVNLADIGGKDLAKAHEDRLVAVADSDRRAAGDIIRTNLALGRLYDARGDYAHAFERFATGNKVRHALQPFDMAAFRGWVSRQIAAFSADLMATTRGIGSESDVPVFIVGLPRTGTTLVERIIDAHPQGFGQGESQDLYVLARRLPALIAAKPQEPGWGDIYALARRDAPAAAVTVAEYPDCMRDLSAEVARTVATDFVTRRQAHAPKARRIADKSTAHWQFVGLARVLLPRAGFVHVTRDPADALLSIFSANTPGEHPYPSDLGALAIYWREYQRLMAHWRTLAPMTEVYYEDLVRTPETAAKSVLSGIGLPWDAAVLRFAESARPVTTQSRAQVRQPLTAARVGHAKHYADFLRPLAEALAGK